MKIKSYISLAEEKREETFVSEKLKSIWNTELDLTVKFLEVCKKYNIKVFAFAGTLLGAVRHKGFIPWDDDIDFALLRPDFEKLLGIASKEFNGHYFFQTALNDRDFFFGYARLRNSETTGLITYNLSEKYNNGIYIDIFVLDGFVDDEDLLTRQLKNRDFFLKRLSFYNYNAKNDKTDFARKIYRKIVRLFARTKPYEYWFAKYNETISRYNDIATKFGLVTHPKEFLKKYYADKSDLEELLELDFESIKIPVPKNYDSILKNMYGDYMEYPPLEVRGQWHNNVIEFDPYTPYTEYVKNKLGSGNALRK